MESSPPPPPPPHTHTHTHTHLCTKLLIIKHVFVGVRGDRMFEQLGDSRSVYGWGRGICWRNVGG